MNLGGLSLDEDSICALSSGSGAGALAVCRVSGPRAYEISRRIAPFLPQELDSHRARVGVVHSFESGDAIDEVVALPFARGRSFTGEESCEFTCHGNPSIVSRILRELVAAGCRMARPGEFTFRAFMNGRLDLVQAESVLSLIESRTPEAARASLRQLKGSLSKEFASLEDGVVWTLAHLEASIDFAEQGIEVVPSKSVLGRVDEMLRHCDRLLGSYSDGRLIQEGLTVALLGEPNVGKSSLLNVLLQEDRAIVTAEAGTTRDLVEGSMRVDGGVVRLIDTAGLRETQSEAELRGIERTKSTARSADIVLAVIDGSRLTSRLDAERALSVVDGEGCVTAVAINKIDEWSKSMRRLDWLESFAGAGRPAFALSAKTGEGLDGLRAFVAGRARAVSSDSSEVVLHARHFEVLSRIRESLAAARRLIAEDGSPEFIAFELRNAVFGTHELLGKRFDEQVIDRIFKEFCLGK